MDWKLAQQRLGVTADGIAGPVTYAALFRAAGCRDSNLAADMGRQAAIDFPKYNVDTPLRLAHFMAQAGHETGGFVYLKEIWGPTPAQRGYEGRKDLGNTQPGDGRRYCGRGIFQVTGRANYRELGEKIGVDLEAHPERAADPAIAVTLACLYWQSRRISALADADDVEGVTRKINGGRNGLADRKARLAAIRKVLGA